MTQTILLAGGGTGGHLMPALALADTIAEAHPDWRIVLAGAKRGVEARVLPSRSYPYTLLSTEPIYRREWWKNARWPLLAFRLMREVRDLLDRERPSMVVGTGGYASGPVVWRAAARGIPTAIQEQNAYPGLATRWLARRVQQIYLGVPEASRLLSPGRGTEILDTGNPIRPPDPGRRPAATARFGLPEDRPVVLVTGGSQGSLALNELTARWLDQGGGEQAGVLWVTGRLTHERFARYHRPPAVHVIDFLDPMADGWAVADLVLSRAGMMTIAELCAWGLPSILIPLPTAAADHQTPNARVMGESGAAVFLSQTDAPGRLSGEIARLLGSETLRADMAARARIRGRPGAATAILDHMERVLRLEPPLGQLKA